MKMCKQGDPHCLVNGGIGKCENGCFENVRRLPVERHDLDDLVKTIKEVIYKTAGKLTVTEVIGALELAKIEIFNEQKDKS